MSSRAALSTQTAQVTLAQKSWSFSFKLEYSFPSVAVLRAMILLRPWCYISSVLTYLQTRIRNRVFVFVLDHPVVHCHFPYVGPPCSSSPLPVCWTTL